MIEIVEKELPEEMTDTSEESNNKDIATIVDALMGRSDFRDILINVLKNDPKVINTFDDTIELHRSRQNILDEMNSLVFLGYFGDMHLNHYIDAIRGMHGLCGAVLFILHRCDEFSLLGAPIHLVTLHERIASTLYKSRSFNSVKDALEKLDDLGVIQCVFDKAYCYISFNFSDFLLPDCVTNKITDFAENIDWENILVVNSADIKRFHSVYCGSFLSHQPAFQSPSNVIATTDRMRLHVSFFFIEFLLENGCTPSASQLVSYLNIKHLYQLMEILDLCAEWITGYSWEVSTIEKNYNKCGMFSFDMNKFEEFLFDIRPSIDKLKGGKKLWKWSCLAHVLPTTSMVMERRYETRRTSQSDKLDSLSGV